MLKLWSEMTVNVAFSPIVHTRGVDITPQAVFTLTQERQNLQLKGYGFKVYVWSVSDAS